MRSHAWIDRRSLALHEAVAAKIEGRPELLQVARANLARWISRAPFGALLEWQELLERSSVADVVAILRSDSEPAAAASAVEPVRRPAHAGGTAGHPSSP